MFPGLRLDLDRAGATRGGYNGAYLPSRDEFWLIAWHKEEEPDNPWITLSRSKNRGQTWSEEKRLNLVFPAGRAYAGGALNTEEQLRELGDGSVGLTISWVTGPMTILLSVRCNSCAAPTGARDG